MVSKKKTAMITGITGQDGLYLTVLLLKKGYEVHGVIRRSSSFHTSRIDHIYQDPHNQINLFLHYGDLADASSLNRILRQIKLHEIYNLGAQSHVQVSFDYPDYTVDTIVMGTIRLLVLQLYLWNRTSFVVPIFGDPLVPAAPRGPSENTLNALLCGQHETPEEATNLADTQRHTSPRAALKAVRLLRVEPCAIFFNSGTAGRCAARSTVNSA